MKITRKITAVLLSLLMVFSILPCTVFATTPNTPKEEVVYVNLNGDGSVKDIYVVNIFDLDEDGQIVDYGDYENLRNMTSTDEIDYENNKVTIDASAGKLYYEGKLKTEVIPWNIKLNYYIDDKEYSADEIAGMSGALKIKMSITENSACQSNFFEGYALQVAFTLDTEKCNNIIADGATVANVGSNKQLTYTVLPNKGLESEISADVSDFEMDSVSVNGIKLKMNIEIDDSELMEKVNELMDATKELNDGANSLGTGTDTLKSGSSELTEGASSLNSGVSSLDKGVVSLQSGATSMQEGLDELSSKSETLTDGSLQFLDALNTLQNSVNSISVSGEQISKLTESSSAIKQGINDLYDGASTLYNSIGYEKYKAIMSQNGLDIDALQSGNTQAIATLSEQVSDLQAKLSQIEGVSGYETQVLELKAQIANLQMIIQLLNGNNATFVGTEQYLDSLSQGAETLLEGITTLKANYEKFDTAIYDMANTLGDMLVKLSDLTEGVNTLVEKYTELDSGITEYTNGVATVVNGYSQIFNGVNSLAFGSKELLSGSAVLAEGTDELYSGVSSLCSGTKALSEGTEELYDNTSNMNTQVEDKIDEILSSISGDEVDTVSFVSKDNTQVDSVQFVIKTSNIEKLEIADNSQTETETLNFWQKLLKLFGWN